MATPSPRTGMRRSSLPRARTPRAPRRSWQPRLAPLEDRCLMAGNVWSQSGGNAGHTGYVDINVNPARFTDAWTAPLNYVSWGTGSWAERAVAIDGTRVYRTDLEGYAPSGYYHVLAYDLQTGAQAWKTSIKSNAFEGVSEPSVANGVVYVNRAGHSGISGGTSEDLPYVYALNAQTGGVVTRSSYSAQWGSNERPVIEGNQLVSYNGYYGGMGAWSLSPLASQWSISESIYDTPNATLDAQSIYAYGNKVFARSNGALVATIAPPQVGGTMSSPVVSDTGRLFYSTSAGSYSTTTYGVAAYNASTRALQWSVATPSYVAGKAVGNGLVAVATGSQLLLLDEATGATVRTWQSAGEDLAPDIVLTRTHAIVETSGSGTATVHAINLATGQDEWTFTNTLPSDEGSGSYMEVALGGGYLVVSHDKFVRAFNLDGTNHAPAAVNDAVTTAEDTPVTIPVLANDSDPDGDPLTIIAVVQPERGSVKINADGTLAYTPRANLFGTDQFTYTISDGRGRTATATVSVSVAAVSDPPVAAGWQFVTNEDVPLIEALRASDPDGDPITYTIVSQPEVGTVALTPQPGNPGRFTYTPLANYNGTVSFTFKVNDGTADSNVARVFVTVRPVNDVPVARDDAYATTEDTPLLVAAPGLLANDSDIDSTSLSALLVSNPSMGTLTLNADGSFVYTPYANASGVDRFLYRVSDGSTTSNFAAVRIDVSPVNDAPVAVAGPHPAAYEGQSAAFDGRGSSDADGDALTYSWDFGDGATGTGPTPTHTFTDDGTYVVTLTVDDGRGGTDTDVLTVVVGDLSPTVVISGPATGVRGQVVTLTVSATDPSPVDQGASFVYMVDWNDGTGPTTYTGGSSITVSHVCTYSGNYMVVATATDKDGATGDPGTFALTIGAIELQAGNTLVIGGTTGADTIVVAPSGSALAVTLNGAKLGTYSSVAKLVVYGQDGDDSIQIDKTKVKSTTTYVTVPAVVDAGAGKDTVDARGSTADNILLGGDGNDTLWGGRGRDLLIGGLGADILRGGDDDDLIIGGTTDFDQDLAALGALMAEWSRRDVAYATRVDRLSGVAAGGRNGGYVLTLQTVHTDDAIDQLYGENGQDWFFYDPTAPGADAMKDRRSDERVTNL